MLHRIAAAIGGGVSVAKAKLGRERRLHPPIELSLALSSKVRDSILAGSYQLVIRARFISEKL